LIKHYCLPNALTTFKEYLVNYAQKETRTAGEKLISEMLNDIPGEDVKDKTKDFLKRVEKGEQDLYV
ncbi:MAG: [FeFe] hydrogenase H-cluster radical SAM maturase HydG, partial [bacterium]|nr:[FeFe] hydrogenase H-cluster radical SAM maturase HydG [bacterium]